MANPANVRQLPPIHDGLLITVQGKIWPHANTFSVNLCAGPNYGTCDTALHVNPRYYQNNVVVRNSFINGGWGPEERGGAAFFVPKGQQLDCMMLIQHHAIKVAFNGQHYCEYRHRIPKERITHVIVVGDMQLQTMITTASGPSLPPMGGVYVYPTAGASSVTVSCPAPVPYDAEMAGLGLLMPVPAGYPIPAFGQPVAASTPNMQFIPGGLYPGRLIYITATPGPSRFAVNLRYQQHGGDIAFHFNPRVKEGVVVRNSLLSGSWGSEEKDQPSFPFQAGQQFTMIILCEPTEFKVAVNNQHFIAFRSRTPNLQAIQWVEVESDATVSSIYVQ